MRCYVRMSSKKLHTYEHVIEGLASKVLLVNLYSLVTVIQLPHNTLSKLSNEISGSSKTKNIYDKPCYNNRIPT